MRPIDADKLIEWLTNPTGFLANCEDCNSYGRECVLCIVEEAIQNAPTIEAEPVRHGIPVAHYKTWFNSDGEPVTTLRYGYKCPFCGDTDIKRFCPTCGTKMDGKKE